MEPASPALVVRRLERDLELSAQVGDGWRVMWLVVVQEVREIKQLGFGEKEQYVSVEENIASVI